MEVYAQRGTSVRMIALAPGVVAIELAFTGVLRVLAGHGTGRLPGRGFLERFVAQVGAEVARACATTG